MLVHCGNSSEVSVIELHPLKAEKPIAVKFLKYLISLNDVIVVLPFAQLFGISVTSLACSYVILVPSPQVFAQSACIAGSAKVIMPVGSLSAGAVATARLFPTQTAIPTKVPITFRI